MKITATLLLISALHVSARSFSQAITYSGKDVPLAKVFSAVENQTGYRFFYDFKQISGAKPVTLDVKSMPLSQFLTMCLQGQPFTFTIEDKTIAISEKTPTLQQAAEAPPMRIHGKVVDEQGIPIPGISVQIKGTHIGTSTNDKGEFWLDNVDPKVYLVFSGVSVETQNYYLAGTNDLHVTLRRRISDVDQMVVIGYGASSKRYLTGSVATVSEDDIAKQPVENPLDAMEGRMAGVAVTPSSGLPGASLQIQIRGQVSLNSGSMPLYVVDGVPYNFYNGSSVPATDDLNAFGLFAAQGGVSPFNSLNPSDIESITVLKDADATAIYGSRGGNGVVLITTKKGKSGKTRVTVNAYTGTGQVGHFIPMLSGPQYLNLRQEAFANDNVTPNPATAPDLTTWSQTNFTNWEKTLLGGTAQKSDIQLSMSGGNENTSFVFSPGWHHETTVFPGHWGDTRFSGRLNVEHRSQDRRFYAMIAASYSNDKSLMPSGDLTSLYDLPPNFPEYANGQLNWGGGLTNPYSYLMQPTTGITANFGSSILLKYTILSGLDLKLTGGYTTIDLNQVQPQPAESQNPIYSAPVSSAQFADNYTHSYIVEPQAEFARTLGRGHLDVLAGMTFQQNLAQGYTMQGTNYTNDALLGSIGAAGTVYDGDDYDLYKYTSVFGRANYNFAGKYVLDGTIRRDGSSRFGTNEQFGTFGAGGVAWIFTAENAIKRTLPWLSFGKLRASYGITGNDQIENYQFLNTYTTTGSALAYQGNPISYPSRLANDKIHWETNDKLEGALELGFLKDRIMFTAAYYKNLSGDQLIYVNTPAQVGFSSYFANFPATIQNTGWELTLNTTNIRSGSFKWTTALNFTIMTQKLVKFQDLADQQFYSGQYAIGYPVPPQKLYVVTGINPANGDITYNTKNANGLPSYGTDQINGNPGHPFYGGVNNTFSYKAFDFGFFITFNEHKGYTNGINGNSLGDLINQNTSVLNHWEKPGDVKPFGVPTATPGIAAYNAYGYGSYTYDNSTAFYGNASWVKLKNINVAYNLPKLALGRLGMANLRVYALAQNVFTVTNIKNVFDPELGGGSGGFGGPSMPQLRTFVLGLNASF